MTKRPYLEVVGGFLGAGKTTLILAAARELAKRGMKSGILLNDQGDSLVDTQLSRRHGFDSAEVTGGCFCCQFPDFLESAQQLRSHSPDIIFAEPVGSCTDLSVTVLNPLREAYSGEFRLAPFTVCVDPGRAREMNGEASNPHMAFLFRNQLAEADLVCYTKSDLYTGTAMTPGARYVSARTGQGVAAWLDEILSGGLHAGSHRLDIDYGHYARAEAALAWLNLSASLHCDPPVSPAMLVGPLMDRIGESLDVVHLKVTDNSDSGFLKGALCSRDLEPAMEGSLDASPAVRHELLINLRAVGEPEPVRAVVEAAMAELSGRVVTRQLACFTPAPPRPL
jgi:CobW/HypB/UreG, nucleotide-binding domain